MHIEADNFSMTLLDRGPNRWQRGEFCRGENDIKTHAPHPSSQVRVKMVVAIGVGEQSPKTI